MSTANDSLEGMPSVAVVTVTYNRYEPLLVLFDQLSKLDYNLPDLDIFLVDNASTDETVERVREHFPEVHIIENPENSGVSAGFNRSIQEALNASRDYKYLWLLDSDAEVEPATLKIMIEAMESDETIGVAGSSVYDPKNRDRMVTAGLRVDWKRGDIPLFIPSDKEMDQLVDVDLIPACSMLTRASVYSEVGLWDNRFPLYWGDTDWCTRVLTKGHRVCCVPASKAWHRDWSTVIRGFGAGNFIRDHLRGAFLYFLRHGPEDTKRGARRLMLKSCVKAGLEYLTVRHDYADAYLDATSDLLSGRFNQGLNTPSKQSANLNIDQVGGELAKLVSHRPAIVLNQIADTEQKRAVKEALEPYFERVNWIEIAPEHYVGAEWSEYRAFKPKQLFTHFGRVLSGFGRPDVNVCDISTPLLYNFFAGRYTVFIDDKNCGLVVRSSVVASLGKAMLAVLKGVKAAYFDLPRELRRSRELRAAVFDDCAKNCSTDAQC